MTLTAEKTSIPEIEKMPTDCKICDLMITLGLSNSICQALPSGEKTKCLQLIKPLEDKKQNPVDTLAAILVELGDDQMNSSIERVNAIVWQATAKAKEILIAKGKLTVEGFPTEPK